MPQFGTGSIVGTPVMVTGLAYRCQRFHTYVEVNDDGCS